MIDDYGQVGNTASNARYVLAENGQEYIIKGPSLSPAIPYVAANELIAARLADALGLPVLDHNVVTCDGSLFFASAWMQKPSFYPMISEELLGRCENRERVYQIVVFDIWIGNVDRHEQNLVVRRLPPRGALEERLMLLLNDHSHCLLGTSQSASEQWASFNGPPNPFIRLDFLRKAIEDASQLNAAISQIEALEASEISNIIQSTPTPFLSMADQPLVENLLVARQATLRTYLEEHKAFFPMQ